MALAKQSVHLGYTLHHPAFESVVLMPKAASLHIFLSLTITEENIGSSMGVPRTWPLMPLARIKAPDLRDDSQALLPGHLSNVQNPVSRLCVQKTLSQKFSRGFRECNCGFRAVNFMKLTFAELSPQSEEYKGFKSSSVLIKCSQKVTKEFDTI